MIALRFAREGAKVVLAARSRDGPEQTANQIAASGGVAVVAPTDLRAPAEVEALAHRIESGLGGADVVISNSGIAGPTAELWNVAPKEWEATMRVNVTGTFLVCRSLLPGMLRHGSGSIVVFGSTAGKRPLFGRTPYAASKMALVGLVRTLALELGPLGVRVSLISPGAIAGPRIESVIREQARAAGASYEAVYDEYTKAAPLGRFITPEEVADAAVFSPPTPPRRSLGRT